MEKRELLVKTISDGSVVHRINVTGRTDNNVNRIMRKMYRYIDTINQYVVDSATGHGKLFQSK